jgi:anti-anti-sigma factor
MEKLEVTQQRGIPILKVLGDIENEDGRQLLETLRTASSHLPFRIIDMPHTQFLDSAALEALENAALELQKSKKQLLLSSVTADAAEILHVTQLDRLCRTYPSLDQALPNGFDRPARDL